MDKALSKAANIALDNRNEYNANGMTAGHGRIHEALIEARLKRGDCVEKSLLEMMKSESYYNSLMTDHDTNRRFDAYCTDTAFGSIGVVNEALLFSNNGVIEILPALPKKWKKGEIRGLMARVQAEVSCLSWDTDEHFAKATIKSGKDNNKILLGCGVGWIGAKLNGRDVTAIKSEYGNYIEISLDKDNEAVIEFLLN